MAGIRTTTVTNCFIRLAAREPFHSRLAPQGCYSSWLYALFSSTSMFPLLLPPPPPPRPPSSSSPPPLRSRRPSLSTRAAEDNVTRGWMNGRTRILAAGGRCFFEIEPNRLTYLAIRASLPCPFSHSWGKSSNPLLRESDSFDRFT